MKNLLKITCVLVFLLLVVGCARTVSSYDAFSETKLEGTRNNVLPQTFLGPLVRIDPYLATKKTGETNYFFRVEFWNQNGWLFITSGESLIFLADDERVPLSGDGSANHREVQLSAVDEVAHYSFTPDILKKLAASKAVRVRLVGSNRVWDGKLSSGNQKVFSDFAVKYCH